MSKREDFKSESENEIKQCELRNSYYLDYYSKNNNSHTERHTGQVINGNNHSSIENEVSSSQRDSGINVYVEHTTNITNLE